MRKLFKLDTDVGIPEVSERLPSDFPIPPPSTGTVDDDDDPADERTDENEACVRENNENTEARREVQLHDADRDAD